MWAATRFPWRGRFILILGGDPDLLDFVLGEFPRHSSVMVSKQRLHRERLAVDAVDVSKKDP